MNNVINFSTNISYKVLFNLPDDKVIEVHKTAQDNFDLEISQGKGVAYIRASGKKSAANKIQKVFPSAEIIEATPI
jgi:hypothetical protein